MKSTSKARLDRPARHTVERVAPPPGGECPPTEQGRFPTQIRLEALLFFLAVFLIYINSPIIASGDSRFVIPTALNIIRHGRADIDAYSSQFPEASWAARQEHGHTWNVYPIGVPFMILPLVWVADKGAGAAGFDLEAASKQRPALFLELILASIIAACAAALLFCYCRERLSLGQALLLAGLFALGTAVYSSASRGLWQHGPSMLLLIAALLIYERLERWKWPGAMVLGFCAGYSYAVRPANMAVTAGFTLLVVLTARRRLLPFAGGVVLGVAPLLAFNLAAFGTWSSYYYRLSQGNLFSLHVPLGPLCATLISPSRGLFVFSPFLLFVFARFLPSYRRQYKLRPIEMLLIGLALAFWLGAARWFMWWGGGSYGPRILTELLPSMTILLIPVVAGLSLNRGRNSEMLTVLFVLTGLLSVGIHLRGATSRAAVEWNGTPISVDEAPQRVWSWRDPQFLRGLPGGAALRTPQFTPPAGARPLAFYALPPCRVLDTRSAAGVFGGPGLVAGVPRRIPVPDSACDIPRGAAAYALNLTAMPRGPLGWLEAWPAGERAPSSSVLNALTGLVTANAAIVQAGQDGAINVMGMDATDLAIDITGYFAPVTR